MKDSFVVADLGDKVDATKNKLAVDKIEVPIDPRAEWSQIFMRRGASTATTSTTRTCTASTGRRCARSTPLPSDLSVRRDLNAS